MPITHANYFSLAETNTHSCSDMHLLKLQADGLDEGCGHEFRRLLPQLHGARNVVNLQSDVCIDDFVIHLMMFEAGQRKPCRLSASSMAHATSSTCSQHLQQTEHRADLVSKPRLKDCRLAQLRGARNVVYLQVWYLVDGVQDIAATTSCPNRY